MNASQIQRHRALAAEITLRTTVEVTTTAGPHRGTFRGIVVSRNFTEHGEVASYDVHRPENGRTYRNITKNAVRAL